MKNIDNKNIILNKKYLMFDLEEAAAGAAKGGGGGGQGQDANGDGRIEGSEGGQAFALSGNSSLRAFGGISGPGFTTVITGIEGGAPGGIGDSPYAPLICGAAGGGGGIKGTSAATIGDRVHAQNGGVGGWPGGGGGGGGAGDTTYANTANSGAGGNGGGGAVLIEWW